MEREFILSDYFVSIQGEGATVGSAALFIRFAGCNQQCIFCDESFKGKFNEKYQFDWPTLIALIDSVDCDVVVTGGEPLLQLKEHDLDVIATHLGPTGRKLLVETNGSIMSRPMQPNVYFTISPKGNFDEDWYKTEHDREVTWKILVDENGTLSNIPLSVLLETEKVFLQPLWGNEQALQKAIELVKQYPQSCRLSVQLHKYIGVM